MKETFKQQRCAKHPSSPSPLGKPTSDVSASSSKTKVQEDTERPPIQGESMARGQDHLRCEIVLGQTLGSEIGAKADRRKATVEIQMCGWRIPGFQWFQSRWYKSINDVLFS